MKSAISREKKVMTTIRRIFRPAALLAAVTAVLMPCTAAGPAFAGVMPPSGGGGAGNATTPAPPVVVHTVTVTAGGTPGWQIALLMVGAALLAAAAAVLVDRMRAARRGQLAESAR